MNNTIVVLGNGFKKNRPAHIHRVFQYRYLTDRSKLRCDAALILISMNKFSTVLFSGGFTGGSDWISEAEAMKNYCQSVTDDQRIISILKSSLLDESSYDSMSNLKEATLKLSHNNEITVLSSLLHIPRLRTISGMSKLNIKFISAESVIWINDTKKRMLVLVRVLSIGAVVFMAKEILYRFLIIFEKRGLKLSRIAAIRIRSYKKRWK